MRGGFDYIAFIFTAVTLSSYSISILLGCIRRVARFIHDWKEGHLYE